MPHNAKSEISVTVRPVIVRACVNCGGPRQISVPCASCGLTAEPQTTDLGIQAANFDNAAKQLWWKLYGEPAAKRRALRANREIGHGD